MKHQVLYAGSEKCWTVESLQEVSYRVRIEANLFNVENAYLANHFLSLKRCLVFIDKNVSKIYEKYIQDYFTAYDITPHFYRIDVLESRKNINTYTTILDAIYQFDPLRYSEPFIVIGGGVLLDIAGFAAASFRRGIPYIRIPTTLLGMVDAAIGIKNGINFHGSKNRLGTFFSLHSTIIEAEFLQSLAKEHIRNGLAEILKMAIVTDYELFTWLENYGEKLLNHKFGYDNKINQEILSHGELVISRAISLMLGELAPNLYEQELKRKVDFGHTWSPFIELSTEPPLLHGYAVNIDMALSCVLAKRRGYISHNDLMRILTLMNKLQLPLTHKKLTLNNAWTALLSVVKHRDGKQNLPLPEQIGNCCFVNDVSINELEFCLDEIGLLTKELMHDRAYTE